MTQQDLFSQRVPLETKTPKALTINDMFGLTKQGYLEECRKEAKRLLRTREVVTIEDVTMLVPRPTYIHRNTTGAVFDKQFKPVGFVKAEHKEAKGRWIRTWKLK